MIGMGGAGLTHKWATQPLWSAKRIIAYGLTDIVADASTLVLSLIGTEDGPKMLDTLTLTKSD